MKPRRGRPVDRANPTTRYWTNPVNASATNRQPEPTTDQASPLLRYLRVYHEGMRRIGHYLDDLEMRFPDSSRR